MPGFTPWQGSPYRRAGRRWVPSRRGDSASIAADGASAPFGTGLALQHGQDVAGRLVVRHRVVTERRGPVGGGALLVAHGRIGVENPEAELARIAAGLALLNAA